MLYACAKIFALFKKTQQNKSENKRKNCGSTLLFKVRKIRGITTATNLATPILMQRGFLGQVKVRNLVLLMAVTLF